MALQGTHIAHFYRKTHYELQRTRRQRRIGGVSDSAYASHEVERVGRRSGHLLLAEGRATGNYRMYDHSVAQAATDRATRAAPGKVCLLEPLPILVASAARGGRVVDPLYNALPALRAHGRGALYDGAARIEKCGGVLGGLSNGQLRERLAVTLPTVSYTHLTLPTNLRV